MDLMIHNAAELRTGSFNELTVADFRATWDASVATAVATARAVLPGMVARGRGCLIFCGATASIRGGSGFAAFSSAKFALRGLAQSLAREYQPRGIHVAHVILDGLISGSASARRFGSEVQQVSDTQLMPAKLRGLAARSQSRTDPAGVMKSIYGPGQSASKWNPCLSIRTVEYRSGCSRTTYLGFFPLSRASSGGCLNAAAAKLPLQPRSCATLPEVALLSIAIRLAKSFWSSKECSAMNMETTLRERMCEIHRGRATVPSAAAGAKSW